MTKKIPTRDEKQEEFVNNFVALGARAFIEACTGFGKTWIAFMVAKRLKSKKPDARINVVVPTLVLQKQWERQVQGLGMSNVEVWVINSYVKQYHVCDLLVLDEAHRFTSATAIEFSQALDRTKFDFTLLLSATFSQEEKQFMVARGIHCAGVVTLEEARKNGWVSDFITYNLPLELPKEEREKYDKWNDIFNSYFGKFAHNWNTAMSCMTIKPIIKKQPDTNTWMCWAPDSVHWCKSMGWKGNSPQVAMENYFYNKNLPALNKERRKQKLQPLRAKSVWGNDEHEWSPQSVNRYAAMWHRAMQMRNKVLNTSPTKLKAVIDLVTRLQVKTITFSESVEFAEMVTKELPDISRSYHSYVDGREVHYTTTKKYKTKPDVVTHKTRKISGKAVLKETKELFERDEILLINTARALDEGADFKGLKLGIETSGSSNPRQQVQRTGRVIRREFDKELAVYVRIYAKDTHEEGKVKAQQKGQKGIIEVKSVNEIALERPKSTFGSIINPDQS